MGALGLRGAEGLMVRSWPKRCLAMDKTLGFLFEVPKVLMTGCMYLPLIERVVMPGGALSLPTDDAQMLEVFRRLKANDEFVVLAMVEDAQSVNLSLHPVGCLAMIAEIVQEQGRWLTVFAGVGRVSLGQGYMPPGEQFPRMDVEPLAARCDDAIEARLAISRFRSVSAGLGAEFAPVVDALHRYASMDEEPSLVADRLAGLVGMQDAAWLQAKVLSEPDVLKRFEAINAKLLDFMAVVRASGLSSRPN